jgi:hypothetical protein
MAFGRKTAASGFRVCSSYLRVVSHGNLLLDFVNNVN